MESLPPELISQVLDFIIPGTGSRRWPEIKLAGYATLSRRWQAFIEPCTFSDISINDPKRLEEFQQIISISHKRSYVKKIYLRVKLESYDEEARARFETDEEHQRNNKIFNSTISALFRILADWPKEAGIELGISAWCPSDYCDRQRRLAAAMWRGNDLLGWRYEKSYLEFSRTTTDSECPPVHAVTYLSVEGLRDERPIEPASILFIALKLPQMNRVYLMMKDECRRDEQTRQRLRNEFARHLHLLPASVRHFHLQFQYIAPRDQNYLPPDITKDGTDLLSSHLRDLSQRLEFLHLAGSCVISPELFWPFNPDENLPNLPFWPHLIDVFVEYIEVSPSGQWLLERDPRETPESHSEGELSDEEDNYPENFRVPIEDRKLKLFRFMIIASRADRFYTAAGRAASRMPKLRQTCIENIDWPRYSLEYEVRAGTAKLTWRNGYIRDDPHETNMLGREEQSKRVYQPDEEVFEQWRKAALQHTGRILRLSIKCRGCENWFSLFVLSLFSSLLGSHHDRPHQDRTRIQSSSTEP